MKGDVARINNWLDGVKADRRLTANSVFKVAWQLTRKLNGKEFAKSGKLITWQAIPTLASATGLSERMVRYAVRELEAKGHLAIKTGRGPEQSNRYELIEQLRQPVAAINSGNSGNPLPHSNQQVRQSSVSSAATGFRECGNPLPPNSLSNSIYNSLEPSRDTEPGGSRRVLTALDPLRAEICKAIGPEVFKAWFVRGEAEIVERTDDTIRIEVKTKSGAQYITNQFEPVIARAAGVLFVRIEVKQTAARSAP